MKNNKSKKIVEKRPQSEADIDAFLKQVELINQCAYLQMRNSDTIHPKIKMTVKKDKVETQVIDFPDRESIETFLMRIRPLVVYEEELYVGKVATFVLEGKGEEAEKRLILYRRAIEQRNQSLYSIKIDEKEYSMNELMWFHLYGKYFHLDREKRELLDHLEKNTGFLKLTEMTSLGTLEIYSTIATFLAQDILKMRAGLPLEDTAGISVVK